MKNKLFFLSIIMFLFSCEGNNKKARKNTGPNEDIIVVAENYIFEGEKGQKLKEVFEKEIAGLFPSETFFNLIQVNRQDFSEKNFLKESKNIIILSEEVKDSYTKNKWAQDQIVIYLDCSKEEEGFNKSCQKAFGIMDKKELETIRDKYYINHNKEASEIISNKYKVNIFLPKDYEYIIEEDVFVSKYYASNKNEDLSQHIIIFEFEKTNDSLLNQIKIQTDSILQKCISTGENSYAKIDSKIEFVRDNSFYKGMWGLANDFGGGPLLIKMYEREKKITIVLGVIYCPSKSKRNFLRTFESIF